MCGEPRRLVLVMVSVGVTDGVGVGDRLFADSRLVGKSKGCLVAGNAVLLDRKRSARLVGSVVEAARWFSFEKNKSEWLMGCRRFRKNENRNKDTNCWCWFVTGSVGVRRSNCARSWRGVTLVGNRLVSVSFVGRKERRVDSVGDG